MIPRGGPGLCNTSGAKKFKHYWKKKIIYPDISVKTQIIYYYY
jgi:hypothetical protein